MATVRICVCGDNDVGKSSLIASFVKDVFVTNKIQPVLPQVTLPPTLGTPDNVTTTIVDTNSQPQERETLRKEIRKSNVILLVYSDHYSYERVALSWMPYFRSLGVNVPVVLCANKSDIAVNGSTAQVVEDEMLPLMAEFKEIDSCIRTSAREHHNINEVFFLCQKAVTHPIAPLFDSKEQNLKPAAVSALQRVFYLCDKDQDGYLNDQEIFDFQMKCFEKPLAEDDLANIKRSIQRYLPLSVSEKGIDEKGFIQLNKLFAEKGRHETVWIILRKFHYTDSLSLNDSFLHPKFDVPPFSSAELSPAGYRFFVDLFLLFDKDNDGGLNDSELANLFAPTPGLPPSWVDSAFPSCAVRNEAGYITLQGWLAQWSMTTFEDPKTTLEYLAYLGFEGPNRQGTTAALKITKARRRRTRPGRVERNVFLCYVLGASNSGKSSLLSAFLNRPFSNIYHPTIKPRTAVNTVELHGGKQCYLILEELGELEPAILENQAKLDACDLICYTYDSSDPDSFTHILDLRKRYHQLDSVPAVYTALKADQDKATQRSEVQPDEYTASMNMAPPLHVSVTWSSFAELFVHLAESATHPSAAMPKSAEEPADRTNLYFGAGVVATSRAEELARTYQSRRGHQSQISISDDNHHVTEAIGDMYGDNEYNSKQDSRPLSFMSTPPAENYESNNYFEPRKPLHSRPSMGKRKSSEKSTSPEHGSLGSASGRKPSLGHDSPRVSPPHMHRNNSDAASQPFPLPEIDYESSPAAVAQELSNLQAIRRMSMDVNGADPDLPSFSSNLGNVPTVAPSHSADEDDASRMFWVPARVHPELAPTEFKTFIEEKVDRLRRRSGGEESLLSSNGVERQGSGGGLRRKKSMLSRQIDSPNGYQDGAERLERRRSGISRKGSERQTNLHDLEELVKDPSGIMRSLSIDTARPSNDSGIEIGPLEDRPILPPAPTGQTLKRSTRTTYRKGSLRKGERVPLPKRAAGIASRTAETDTEESPISSPISGPRSEPDFQLNRVQTEPIPDSRPPDVPENFSRPNRKGRPVQAQEESHTTAPQLPPLNRLYPTEEPPPGRKPVETSEFERPRQPQPKPFHSRIASNGRTTAPLPGYTPPPNVPSIVETPPPPENPRLQRNNHLSIPERTSSHEPPPSSAQQNVSYGAPKLRGAGSRPATGLRPHSTPAKTPSQTLDEMAASPSPLPGHSTRTDSLSFIPTFEDRKPETSKKSKDKKDSTDGSRKTSWSWGSLLGSEERTREKEQKAKDERELSSKRPSMKISRTAEKPNDARLDLLQSSIDSGGVVSRGRDSVVINRDDFKLEEERKKDAHSRKANANGSEGKKERDGLLATIFGGTKKKSSFHSDKDSKKPSSLRGLSPDPPPPRILRPDIDYNWTRFSILEERAIYRMAHMKLANPRRALYSQVLLSNFMYSYLAKVQQMHPQIQIAGAGGAQQKQQPQQQQQQSVERSEESTGSNDEDMW
ncbi:MAG: ERMES complex Ca(2+)-binding regulatory GTPase gem1 [Bogoriella megaspora]|nr:MAG: ERMES complex Ca(2+)-binding regulatory GTPase gem1 [Bogoriella megaspora]